MKMRLIKYLYSYKTYLLLGLILFGLTPVIDFLYLHSLSYLFSYAAYVFIIIATIKSIWDQLKEKRSRKLLEKIVLLFTKKIIKRIKK